MKRGFSLIETIIAIAILLIVIIGIVGVLQANIKMAGRTGARVGAVSLVNKRMEMLRNLAYNDVGTIGGIPAGAILPEETIFLNNIEYTLKTFIQYIDDPADGLAESDENGITADYKRARVEISWSGRYAAAPVVAVSDFVPKGIETFVGGGTLIINVFNAPVQPIGQANVHIVNNEVEPNIDINVETNDQGKVVFPGSPSVGKYQVIIAKNGYSTAQTYDATPENPNPDPGHLTILEGETTEASFAIDRVSSLAINTIKPKGESVWKDSFIDQSKVAESSNMDIGGSEAKLSGAGGGVQWLDSSWLYRKEITIDHTKVSGDSDFLNFPVLINFNADSDLAADAQDDGDDILFASSDGITKLDHEIEGFDGSIGELVAWVRIPTLYYNQDTIIYMYYGNSGASNQENPIGVWDSNLKQVLHLKESPNGTPDEIRDSTLNANHGTAEVSATSPSSIEAKIGKGLAFDSSDGLFRVDDSASLDSINDEGTLEMWIKWTKAVDEDWQIIMTSSNRFTEGSKDGFEWASQDDGDHYFYPWGGTDMDYNLGLNPFTNGQWHYLVVTLKDTGIREVKIYVDTVSMNFTIENVSTYWTQLALPNDWLWGGNPDRPTRYFDGVFDEIRVSDIVRSIDWITTSYNNQNSPSTFYSLGEEEYKVEYVSSGYLISTTITPEELVNWDKFSWADDEPENTDIKYQVLYWDGANWLLIPEDDLSGNIAGFDDSPKDLSDLDIISYPQLRIRGNFSTIDTSVSPVLSDWQVVWNDSKEVLLGNVSFEMTGAKTIGTDADGKPIYKYSKSHLTNINGYLFIENLEWDIYDIDLTKIGTQLYDISASSPPEPINIEPNTSNTLKLTLVSHASHTLLATVKNALGDLLINVSVRLSRTGYDETILTGETGQSFFTPLQSGTDYSLEITKPGYQNYSLENVEIDGQTEITVIMALP